MGVQYSLKGFLRTAQAPMVVRYLRSVGVTDEVGEGTRKVLVDRLAELIEALPSDRQAKVEADLQWVHLMANEAGVKAPLDPQDRISLEGLVKRAVARFEQEDDEGRQEEFRQLLRSYMRFYSFVAQVIRLDDTGLEKLYAYAAWLARLLPNREIPPDIEITEDMLRLQAFKVEQKQQGSASLQPGDTAPLQPISEFGAKPYTEDEARSLSEIIQSFNERHGTQFTADDFLRFEQVNQEILDDDMSAMLRNNAPDVAYGAFRERFFAGAIRRFQRDNEMRSVMMTDAEARERAIRHFFNRALREVREAVGEA